jgi:UDP-N-acetylmuramate dehydrogenase
LIEHSGVHKGFHLPDARVAVSSKHTLALTNRGGGTTAQLLALARVIRSRVETAFGITLVPEPVLWGCAL